MQKQSGQQEQTVWQLLDSTGGIDEYLIEDDNDVAQIIDLIEKHISAVDNRSEDDLNYVEETETYSFEFLEMLEHSNYQEKLNAMYTDNGLKIQSLTVLWNPSTINADRTSCKIDIDSIFTFVAGDDAYLSSLGVSTGTSYVEHRIYYCEKTDQGWRITNIEKSAIIPAT